MDFDFNIVEYYYKSIRKNVMSKDSDVNLAKANTLNLIQEYQLIEKSIITKIINEISKLVQKILFLYCLIFGMTMMKIYLIFIKII